VFIVLPNVTESLQTQSLTRSNREPQNRCIYIYWKV